LMNFLDISQHLLPQPIWVQTQQTTAQLERNKRTKVVNKQNARLLRGLQWLECADTWRERFDLDDASLWGKYFSFAIAYVYLRQHTCYLIKGVAESNWKHDWISISTLYLGRWPMEDRRTSDK
jgi:hypothetical protein